MAFDATCGTCTAISSAVAEASDGKLEVLPLTDPDVQGWRRQSMGLDPEWTPTLLRVDGPAVRAWTGPAMTVPLVRRLGPGATVRVLRALGRLRHEAKHGSSQPDSKSIGRKQFLQLCGGIAAAATLTMMGKTPAFAQSSQPQAQAWVEANKGNLPRTYTEITKHSEPYRKAILRALPPQDRTQLWLDHFEHYRAAHPDLSASQTQVIDQARELAPKLLLSEEDVSQKVRRLEDVAKREFGREGAADLLARLGPADAGLGPLAYCSCATESDYCSGSCRRGGCTIIPSDCGFLYQYDCNGLCY
ncbi:bacteriocin fulvocin C-related protein [Streptomyces sp. SID4917]|nr:bacteriocin fulvocin C-related protein [Streptomyces sp. SID4917]